MSRNYLLAPLRLIAFILWVILMPLIFIIVRALRIPGHENMVHWFHAGLRRILGIHIHISGTISEATPCLYVSNHISYLDIIVLGDLRAYFIAKSEVASWPVFGQLARFQNTLFIERKASRAREQMKIMQNHLSSGKRLTLFPEGTSTDGAHVEPFKSSLFAAADLPNPEQRVPIQAVTIAYVLHDGKPMNQGMRDHYAWYATMPFASHFFSLFPLKKVDVNIHFHPVCYLDEFESRKACADHCQSLVAAKLSKSLSEALHTPSI
ncbi:MAG: lysophospholipid acyltransferase family protein [Pseudomonadota bacterium]